MTPLEELYITVPALPSAEEVAEWAESHEEPRTEPRWAVALILFGSFLLVAAGAFCIAVGVAS